LSSIIKSNFLQVKKQIGRQNEQAKFLMGILRKILPSKAS
jgi:hypothetical protein